MSTSDSGEVNFRLQFHLMMFGKAATCLAAALFATAANAVKVGDMVPDKVTLDLGFPPEKINLAQRVMGKNVSAVQFHSTLYAFFFLVFVLISQLLLQFNVSLLLLS